MSELSISTFQQAIWGTHGCDSEHIDTVHVVETSKGETVWAGEVLVFDLIRHPTAATAYAWSINQQVTAVLHEGPVDSPQAAVTATLVRRRRRRP